MVCEPQCGTMEAGSITMIFSLILWRLPGRKCHPRLQSIQNADGTIQDNVSLTPLGLTFLNGALI